jgi:hypothetical protein
MIAELRRLLAPLLAQRHTAAQRRELAAALRAEADRQEQLAEAAQRDARRPVGQRVAGSGRGGRPGAMYLYIRYEPRPERNEPIVTLRIGRGLYDAYQAQRPDPAADLRFTVQVVGGRLYLVESPDGYLTNVNVGGVRLAVSGSRDALGGMVELRRYPAEVQRGRIVADLT